MLARSGNGSLSPLASELLQPRSGAKFNLVPYRGSGPALTDPAGGLVAGHFATLASGSTLLSGGRIQAVAVAADWRLPAMPQLNALAEQGAKDVVLKQWWGLVAPVGTPPKAIERIPRELYAALGHTSMSVNRKVRNFQRGLRLLHPQREHALATGGARSRPCA